MISLTLKLITVSTFILNIEYKHKLNSNRNSIENSYDFIVVGSGAAGAVVAHRLAQSCRSRVLLLEAGKGNGILNDIPGEYVVTTAEDWNYSSVEQSVGLAFKNRRIPEPRAKVLGGTTCVNGMIFNRGNRRTYDEWQRQYGANGWSYDQILPYFKKWENNRDPNIVGNGYHGTGGPVEVTSWPKPVDPLMLLHQKAINELGFKTIDVNSGEQWGTATAQAFIGQWGNRSNTANAYLDPNPFPKYLHILTKAFVTQILFNGKTAIGVQYIRNGKTYSVRAEREVIVSAGVFNSPQLLMLSGIGPKEHLQGLGIPVRADLPVGLHYQNHPQLEVNALIREEFYDLINSGDSELSISSLYDYTRHTGLLTKVYHSVTYLSSKSNRDKSFPNLCMINLYNRYWSTLDGVNNTYGERRQEWLDYFAEFRGKYWIYFHPLLERIRSYGSVRLQSNNPYDSPLIDPKFLNNSQDFEDFVEVVKFTFHFIERSSFAQFIKPHKPIPGCDFCPKQRYIYECDRYIRCIIRQVTATGYHPVGTCRMGAINRADTVLDPRLRVKGFKGLRVCDASVMPTITNGNTESPTLMIGEKCADMAKEDNLLSVH